MMSADIHRNGPITGAVCVQAIMLMSMRGSEPWALFDDGRDEDAGDTWPVPTNDKGANHINILRL